MFRWFFSEFLGNIWDGVYQLIDRLAEPFTDPVTTFKKLWGRKAPSKLRRFVGLLVLLTVFVGLGALTWVLGLERHAEGPWFFRKTWMGWLALLVYIIVRLLLVILRQIRVLSPAMQSYPDIDAGIDGGAAAAAAAGVDLDRVPVFLVVGLSRTAESEFRRAASVGQEVCFDDAGAALHWYGNPDALWITAPGVSATSAQADLLVQAQQRAADRDSPFAAVRPAGAAPPVMADTGKTIGGEFLSEHGAVTTATPRTDALDVAVVGPKQRSEARERWEYVCAALQRVRYPVCTVNAVVLCVPFNEHVVADNVTQTFRDCVKVDMTILQESLGVRCLTMVVFAGCNDNADLRAYIERLPPRTVSHRCGVSYPQLVELAPGDPERMHQWLQRDFELQAMHLFKAAAGEPSNESLFRFVDLFRRAGAYLSTILNSAYVQAAACPFYFGGAYLGELASVGSVSHPFFDGVLVKVLHEHDELICWSPQALADDGREKRTSRVLLALAVLVMAGNAGLLWMTFMN